MNFPLQQAFPNASRLVYGCMGLGGSWDSSPVNADDRAQARDAIETALECDIRVFDHADIYRHGKAEQLFGEILRGQPDLRDRLLIQSKCGIRPADEDRPGRYDLSPAWIQGSVDGILRRLGIETLDLLLLHRPDPLMEPERIGELFGELKRSGKVRAFGVSNMDQHQLASLQRAAPDPLRVNQIPMSLAQLDWLEQGVLTGTPAGSKVDFSPGLLDYCRHHGVQIQAWGALARGLYSGGDPDSQEPAIRRTAELVKSMAGAYGCRDEAIVLAWLLRHPLGIQPVIGTTDPARIRACAEALAVNLSREHWYALYVSARGQPLP